MDDSQADDRVGYTVVDISDQAARIATLADLMGSHSHKHDTLNSALQCTARTALESMLHDLFRQSAWWADMDDANTYADKAVDRIMHGADVNIRLVILVGLAAQLVLDDFAGSPLPAEIVAAYDNAHQG